MHELVIAETSIRTDAAGRYCLNDLHRASGGAGKDKPGNWLATNQTKALIGELERGMLENQQAPIITVNDGRNNGTFVAKELVYAYAMWISPAFHLRVIRAYDAMVAAPALPDPMQAVNDPAWLRAALLGYSEKVQALETTVAAQAPKVDVYDRLVDAAGMMCLRDAAAHLNVPERKFTGALHAHGWIYRRPGKSGWLAHAEALRRGVVEYKIRTYVDIKDGIEKVNEQVMVTPFGLARLAELVKKWEAAASPAEA